MIRNIDNSTPDDSNGFSKLLSSPLILSALTRLKFNIPTPVQLQAIPSALEDKDLIIQAQTGSGKTLAFSIPLLIKLEALEDNSTNSSTYGLIITPTRELASQITEVINSFQSKWKPVSLIGGEDIERQISALKENKKIVVGTPGRILDLLRRKVLRLNRCRYFVLDEADEMLSMGFLEDIRAILTRLPDERQGLFVSATITPRVEMLASSFLSKPEVIFIKRADGDEAPIEHFYCEVGGDLMAKPSVLCDIIETQRPLSTIIFCNTKSDTQLVEALLRRRGFDARRINSDLTQSARNKIMQKIKSKDLQFLVATDIAARGIDIEEIELVINYTIHEQPEIYIHRTGRTGRAGHRGRAISLIGPRDIGAFHFLTKVVEFPFKKLPIPTDEEVCNARLAHLYEIVREAKVQLKERDLILARKFLSELGEIHEPSEELETTLAKLCSYSIERFIEHDIKSLDEESSPKPSHQSERKYDKKKKKRRNS
jgi:ATP-dependent RNA helicase DeaD